MLSGCYSPDSAARRGRSRIVNLPRPSLTSPCSANSLRIFVVVSRDVPVRAATCSWVSETWSPRASGRLCCWSTHRTRPAGERSRPTRTDRHDAVPARRRRTSPGIRSAHPAGVQREEHRPGRAPYGARRPGRAGHPLDPVDVRVRRLLRAGQPHLHGRALPGRRRVGLPCGLHLLTAAVGVARVIRPGTTAATPRTSQRLVFVSRR